MIPIGVDQKLTSLNISEKSIEMLKSILCKKCLSASVAINGLQNFLWHKDKVNLYTKAYVKRMGGGPLGQPLFRASAIFLLYAVHQCE